MKSCVFFAALGLQIIGYSQTNTWTGAVDTNWHKSCNWSLGIIPTASHDVVIPTVTNYPRVTGNAHCRTFDITTAANKALRIYKTLGADLCVSSVNGGTCSTISTDNGGCNLLFDGSFENRSCCPSSPNINSTGTALPCLNNWSSHTNTSTPDYFNTCGLTHIPTFFLPPPMPIPDGTGYVGMSVTNEHIGICLGTSLSAGSSYTVTFKITAGQAGTFSPTMAIFGAASCANLPAASTGANCPPTLNAAWTTLGSQAVSINNSSWNTVTINFVAPSNISAIYLGAACGSAFAYAYIDNVTLI